MLLHYPRQCLDQDRSYHSLTKIISLPFGVIEYIYQTKCMFVTIVAANVSVLVDSIPTGIALRAKLPLARAYWPKHCISSLNVIDNNI